MKNLLLILFLVCASAFVAETFGQGQQKVVIFTGRVLGGKQAEALPGAYIFIPKAGKGTLSDNSGYFALPVYPGDSILFKYLGYKDQYYIVPRRLAEETYSAIVLLKEDVRTLAEVKVYPYATLEEFKRAIVELKLPDAEARENLARNTDSEYLARLAAATPMSAGSNYRNFMNQQLFGRESAQNRSSVTMSPFLNPFAFLSLFRDVKSGRFKKGFNQTYEAPRENVTRQDLLNQNKN